MTKKYTLDDLNKRLAEMVAERGGGGVPLSFASIQDDVRRNVARNIAVAADVQKYSKGVTAKGGKETPPEKKPTLKKPPDKPSRKSKKETPRGASSDVYGLAIKSRLSEKEKDSHGLKSRTNAGKERSNMMGEEWYETVLKGNKARADGGILHTPIVKLLFGASKADADDKKKKGR